MTIAAAIDARSQAIERAAQRRPRVLVLHQHYWPEIAATAQILSDLCEDLVAAGFDVRVVCGQPSYRSINAESLPDHEVRHGVSIHRVWSYTPEHRTIPKRLLHYTSYFGGSLLASLVQERPDVCFVMSTPPLLLGATGALLRLLRNVPFVYSVQDLYPDIAIHLGVLREGGLPSQLIAAAANFTYRSAHSLVALSDGMATRLVEKGVPRSRIEVISNWADTTDVVPRSRTNSLAVRLGLDRGFVVQYSGNLGLSQGLESVLEAAALLKDLPLRIALVGDGNARPALLAKATSMRLENVVFLPPQPREYLSDLLSACDVGLVTMKRDVGRDLVPSKLYGIMAAAKPVLAAVEADSEVHRVVHKHVCGWTTDPESPLALAAAVRTAFSTGQRQLNALGDRGRDACLTGYSRRASTARYVSLLRAVSGVQPVRRGTNERDRTW